MRVTPGRQRPPSPVLPLSLVVIPRRVQSDRLFGDVHRRCHFLSSHLLCCYVASEWSERVRAPFRAVCRLIAYKIAEVAKTKRHDKDSAAKAAKVRRYKLPSTTTPGRILILTTRRSCHSWDKFVSTVRDDTSRL